MILATTPLLLSIIIVWIENKKIPGKRWYQVSLGILWLLFFPNAMYIVSDLTYLAAFHPTAWTFDPVTYPHELVQPGINSTIWTDTPILFLSVFNAIILGYLALRKMQNFITKKFSVRIGWIFTFITMILASIGIFLGRFLRLNSWDAVLHPIGVMSKVSDSAFLSYSAAAFILIYLIIQTTLYLTLVTLEQQN